MHHLLLLPHQTFGFCPSVWQVLCSWQLDNHSTRESNSQLNQVIDSPSPILSSNVDIDLGRGGSEACRDTELTERVWRDRDCSGDSGRSSVMESVQACQEMRQGASNKCESNLCGASGQEQADHHGQDQYAILHTPPPRPHDPPWHSTGNC
jgi:hypothetical protein